MFIQKAPRFTIRHSITPLAHITIHLQVGTPDIQTQRQICITQAHIKFKTVGLVLLFKITTGAYS